MTTEQEVINQYNNQLALAQQQMQTQNQNPYAPGIFQNQQKQNLVELELDFTNELRDIERLLRCDVIMRDKDGNEYWTENSDKTKVFFNDMGVSDFMRNLVIIVNKHKVLANYSIEEINDRVRQIKHEIRNLIYINYEAYGMDNEYKMNNYSMIVISIGSVIEDAYRRALKGATHQGLAEQRLVTQNENMQPQMPIMMMQPQKKGLSKLLPWNWGR